MSNAETELKNFITGFIKDSRAAWISKDFKQLDAVWDKYCADQKVFMVRPSGNPMGYETEQGIFKVQFFVPKIQIFFSFWQIR